jgi:hypothetical protein
VDARSPFAAATPTPAAVQARSPGVPVRPAPRDTAPSRPLSSVEPERPQAAAVSPPVALPVALKTARRELGGSEEHVRPGSAAPAAPAITRYSAADDEDSELELHAPDSAPPPSLPIIEARPLPSNDAPAPAPAPGPQGDAAPFSALSSLAPSRMPWIIAAIVLALIIAAALLFLSRR